MKVTNKKCIRRLALRNMKGMKTRNIAAIIAIALTAILFTSVFTIALSIIDGVEEAGFRRTGTYAHGSFDRLTNEQCQKLMESPKLTETGKRMLVGTSLKKPFQKMNLEISYCDKNVVKWMYLTPTNGRLPKEGSNEAATDTKVLKALGIKPEIGSKFTITYMVNDREITRTYVLSGFWEADKLAPANHILLPESEALLVCENAKPDALLGRYCGLYDLYFMVNNVNDVEKIQSDILSKLGYQNKKAGGRKDYIQCSVNIGYLSKTAADSDLATTLVIIGILLIIIFTGYLAINNLMGLSISGDIQRYGLLKTIGTTSKQIRRMVYIESMVLAGIGIPIGMLIGYVIGVRLSPIIVNELDGITVVTSVNPIIFGGSALFSLLTVWISCMKPARFASKISPIEALIHVEQNTGRSLGSKRKSRKVSTINMAAANMRRNRGKTLKTLISLMLAVLLLDITFCLTNSFDLNKYLRDIKYDDIIAHANYFQTSGHLFSGKSAIDEQTISDIEQSKMVKEGGRTYAIGNDKYVYEYVPKEAYDKYVEEDIDEEYQYYYRENSIQLNERYERDIELYGMENYCLERLTCIDGDLSKLTTDSNAIAAVYRGDDYNNIHKKSWAKVGDTVPIRYVSEYEWYNPDTGEVYDEDELDKLSENDPCELRVTAYHDELYKVCATIIIPNKMSYRYYINDQFVLSKDALLKQIPEADIMYYAYDVKEGKEKAMEDFLLDYTENVMPEYSYESKQTEIDSLDNYRKMFLILGGVLSLVVALIGTINFINITITNAFVRRKEFAVLQAVGMTGKQLKQMLIAEGLYYTVGSICLTLLLFIIMNGVIKNSIEKMFWFCSYNGTILPILCILPIFIAIGTLVPIIVYRKSTKKTVVERLRDI